MSVRLFHRERPESLPEGSRWEPATEKSLGQWASSFPLEKGPGWVVSYEGLVVRTGEHNWYDDSDFYAVVWDESEGQFKETYCGSTRFWTYLDGASVDAPESLKETYQAEQRRLSEERAEAWRAAEEAAEAATPRKGKTVRVVKGRKVPVGTVGEVFWTGETQWGQRVGLKTAEGEKHFTAVSNIEVVVAAPEEVAA